MTGSQHDLSRIVIAFVIALSFHALLIPLVQLDPERYREPAGPVRFRVSFYEDAYETAPAEGRATERAALAPAEGRAPPAAEGPATERAAPPAAEGLAPERAAPPAAEGRATEQAAPPAAEGRATERAAPNAATPIGEAPEAREAPRTGQRPAQAAAQTPAHTVHPIRYVEPEYPDAARRNGISGEVTVEVLIGRRGRVDVVTLVSGSGSDLLDDSVLRTVRLWRYSREESGTRSIHRVVFSLR